MIIIRDYVEKDAEPLLSLVCDLQVHEGQVFDRMKPPHEIGPWYIEALLTQCRSDDGSIIVAQRGDEIIGYATVFTRCESSEEIDEVPYVYGYVGDLSVRPADRGLGIGQLLLDECEARTRAAGRKWLRINVLAANPRAHALYERFGFRDHVVTMEKPLA